MMSSRELIVLGTASQTPLRDRSHNACFLRWDRYGFLFDPGEGAQRQLLLAGVPSSAITHICITHLHGDHSLGLPGILQRMSLDDVNHTVTLCFPASAAEYIDRLRNATIYDERVDIEMIGVDKDGPIVTLPDLTVSARALDHRVDTYGWRLQEPDGRRMIPELLAARGVKGPAVGRLQAEGRLEVDGEMVELEDVSALRCGQSFAFVMDTRFCSAAVELAAGVDLLVAESTYASTEVALALEYGHMTAHQAAELADQAKANRLVLTHFSQRYPDTSILGTEAKKVFPQTHVAHDLMRMALPARRAE